MKNKLSKKRIVEEMYEQDGLLYVDFHDGSKSQLFNVHTHITYPQEEQTSLQTKDKEV